MTIQTHSALKETHRTVRDRFPPSLNLRIHRALSWFERAEMCEDDDGRLIFLWIAFNAAYATELRHDMFLSEQDAFRHFVGKVCGMDDRDQMTDLLWTQFSSTIRGLLNNRYVYRSYWDFQVGKIDEAQWEQRFERAKKRANSALSQNNNEQLLYVVLQRIYTLRNQLVHGGATWNSEVNRRQVRDSARLMEHFVPLVIEVMLAHPEQPWGKPGFPVVDY